MSRRLASSATSPAGSEVAVVIPLFEGAPWIEETLRSVFAQVHGPVEVVVVDDGSTDDGPERAAHFEGVRLLRSTGRLRTRHTGLLATSAPLVAFLDQDDLWHPDHLRVLAEALRAEPDAPLAAASWSAFREGRRPRFAASRRGRVRIDPWATWPVACPFPTPSVALFRRGPLEAAGGWTVDAAPDWEVYLRLTTGRSAIRTRARTCGYRLHVRGRSAALQRDGFPYLEIMRGGADASLAFRASRGLDGPPRELLSRRRRVLDDLERLMRARGTGDAEGVAEAARALEVSVEGEEGAYVDAVFLLLVYLFCPAHDLGAHVRCRLDLLRSLAASWPADAARTGGALRALARRYGFKWRRFLRAAVRGHLARARRVWSLRAVAARGGGGGR